LLVVNLGAEREELWGRVRKKLQGWYEGGKEHEARGCVKKPGGKEFGHQIEERSLRSV